MMMLTYITKSTPLPIPNTEEMLDVRSGNNAATITAIQRIAQKINSPIFNSLSLSLKNALLKANNAKMMINIWIMLILPPDTVYYYQYNISVMYYNIL